MLYKRQSQQNNKERDTNIKYRQKERLDDWRETEMNGTKKEDQNE